MTASPWDRALALPPEALTEATAQLHWAAQLVASAGQTFAEPRDDDSHRAMTWSTALEAFVGADFAGPYPFRLALRPRDLALVLLDRQDGALSVFELRGHSRAEAREWLSVGMATYRGGALPVIERPEYDMPHHPVGDDAPFSAGMTKELEVLSSLYSAAAELLGELFGPVQEASEVRCWPHRFDIATLIDLGPGDEPGVRRSVGVGLAPRGDGYESWYLYVTPSPHPDPDTLPALGSRGAWHTEGWTGAVLTGREVMALGEEERVGVIRRFVLEATTASRRAVGGPTP